MPSIRVRFLGGITADQWTTDDLRRHFGTKDGQVPFIEFIDLFSDTNSRVVVVQIDPKRRIARHADEAPDLAVLAGTRPNFDRPEHGQYAKQFDTDKTTQRMDINEECKQSFAVQCDGVATIDMTIVYHNVSGQYAKLVDVERMADRHRMDRQDSLDDSTDPGFRMGRQIRQMGDFDRRT